MWPPTFYMDIKIPPILKHGGFGNFRIGINVVSLKILQPVCLLVITIDLLSEVNPPTTPKAITLHYETFN